MLKHRFAFFASLVPVACSGADDRTSIGGAPVDGSSLDGTASNGPAEAAPGPLYVVSARVFDDNGDGETGYLTTVASLAAGTTYDFDDAIEIAGGGAAFGREGDTGFYFAAGSEPTITRWEIGADGSFVPGAVLSFANLGLGNVGSAPYSPIYSADKSYFVDQGQQLIVIWNPSTMELIGTIPLNLGTRDNLSPVVHSDLTVRGDRIFAAVWWSDADDWTRLGDTAQLIAIDPVTDQVVSQADETRCNQMVLAGLASDGTAYFSNRSAFTLPRLIFGDGFGVDSCAMRVVPPGERFEDGYDVDLGALVGGRPAGDFALVNDGVAFIRVFHPELVGPTTPENFDVVSNEAGFKWWRWQIGDARASEVEGQLPAANTVQVRSVDGKVYALNYAADFSSTTLDEFGADGTLTPGLSGPGAVYNVVRLR